MDIERHRWRSDLTGFLGPGKDDENRRTDAGTFPTLDFSQDEYRAMFLRLGRNYGAWGRQAQRDLVQYVAGINAYIDAARHDGTLPVEYRNRGLAPRPWSVEDEMAGSAYDLVVWTGFYVREEGNAQVLASLTAHIGAVDALAVYRDIRNHDDPDAPTTVSGGVATESYDRPEAIARLDLGSFRHRDAGGDGDAALSLALVWPQRGWPQTKSNALLIAANRSATGHPIGVQGPQDGLATPHPVDSEIVVTAPDYAARGVLEMGAYPYNGGRGRDFVMSLTAQSRDQIAMFAEKLCEPDGNRATRLSRYYFYKSRCRPFAIRVDHRGTAGAARDFTSIRSVHGPIIGYASVAGEPVALAQARAFAGREESAAAVIAAFFTPSAVHSARNFLTIARHWEKPGAIFYIDRSDIAFTEPGSIPRRNPGTSGDLPIWGTGEWDWRGFSPGT